MNLALLLSVSVPAVSPQRAHRSRVMWPARVRRFNEAVWHGAVVLNLSLTGALLELVCRSTEGEWLAIEIEYPMGNGSSGVFAQCGRVIRSRKHPSTIVAVQFAPSRAGVKPS